MIFATSSPDSRVVGIAMASPPDVTARSDKMTPDNYNDDVSLQPTTASDMKPTPKKTIADLAQELKDEIISYILPKAFLTAPDDAQGLTLELDVEGVQALKAASTIHSIIKLPPTTEAWIQAIKSKKVALILTIEVPEYHQDIPNLLQLFHPVTLVLNFPSNHVASSCTTGCLHNRASLSTTFRHDRWTLNTITWNHTFFCWHDRPQPSFKDYAAKGKEYKAEEIVRGALGSCGKTYSAEQLVEKMSCCLQVGLEEAEEEVRARFAAEVRALMASKPGCYVGPEQ